MTSAASRLLREVRDISSQQIPVVFGEPEEADILHWVRPSRLQMGHFLCRAQPLNYVCNPLFQRQGRIAIRQRSRTLVETAMA